MDFSKLPLFKLQLVYLQILTLIPNLAVLVPAINDLEFFPTPLIQTITNANPNDRLYLQYNCYFYQ